VSTLVRWYGQGALLPPVTRHETNELVVEDALEAGEQVALLSPPG
jgi:hypothetical protein